MVTIIAKFIIVITATIMPTITITEVTTRIMVERIFCCIILVIMIVMIHYAIRIVVG